MFLLFFLIRKIWNCLYSHMIWSPMLKIPKNWQNNSGNKWAITARVQDTRLLSPLIFPFLLLLIQWFQLDFLILSSKLLFLTLELMAICFCFISWHFLSTSAFKSLITILARLCFLIIYVLIFETGKSLTGETISLILSLWEFFPRLFLLPLNWHGN